jgi:SSS family solute:Na+ symporter
VGWNNAFEMVEKFKGPAGFDPFVEGKFGADYVLWMVFGGLVSCALWPTSVARALAAESEQVVRKQYMWASLSYAIRYIVPFFWGICAFVFIMQTPALKQAFFPEGGETEAVGSLYAMPVYMGRILPTGIIAFIAAAMIAAFMSTHDSYLLCWSSVLTNDVIVPLSGGKLSQKAQVLTTRICVVVVAAIIYFVSFVYPLEQDLWDYMMVTGAIYFTGAFALLVLGLYWQRASSTGAVLALLAGCFAVTGLDPVQKPYVMWRLGLSAEEAIKYMHGRDVSAIIGLSTVALAVTAMVFGSLLFPDTGRKPAQGATP